MPGSFLLILHAHLPFVRHPEHEDFLEEDWLFEAITETYLPLIQMMRRLKEDRVPFRLSMSLTPTLCEMLRDELLQHRYLRHLERLTGLAHQEIERNRHQPALFELANFYAQFFAASRDFFVGKLQCDLLKAFRQLQEDGELEIMASAATHAFLPLLQGFPESVRAQVAIGCDSYREIFGRNPTGFWLPECGYYTGLDGILQSQEIRWFVADAHGLLWAKPPPRAAVFAPCFTPAGPAIFARDRESSDTVWNARCGYPGHPLYRDFYRDLGFDRPEEELRQFVRPAGLRKFTGIKYHRVTSHSEEKEFYDPSAAKMLALEHARNFAEKLRGRFSELGSFGFSSILVSAFDAELFGHWWFEGPIFLESLMRQAVDIGLPLTIPAEFLADNPRQQIVRPNPSSWGENGFSGVWLDKNVAGIYPRLHQATRRMTVLARSAGSEPSLLVQRVLRQAARELLLVQASDWPFLIKTRTAIDYATRRINDHLDNFERFDQQLSDADFDSEFLGRRESRTTIFPNLEWRHFI